jgi:hypothetical protein
MRREVDHPAWDRSWSVPTEHTIDDLHELGLLRVEPHAGKRREFVLSLKGRREADRVEADITRVRPTTGRAPTTEAVHRWLVELEREAPDSFDLPSALSIAVSQTD